MPILSNLKYSFASTVCS